MATKKSCYSILYIPYGVYLQEFNENEEAENMSFINKKDAELYIKSITMAGFILKQGENLSKNELDILGISKGQEHNIYQFICQDLPNSAKIISILNKKFSEVESLYLSHSLMCATFDVELWDDDTVSDLLKKCHDYNDEGDLYSKAQFEIVETKSLTTTYEIKNPENLIKSIIKSMKIHNTSGNIDYNEMFKSFMEDIKITIK